MKRNVKEIKLSTIIGIALIVIIVSIIISNIKNSDSIVNIVIQGKAVHALTGTEIEIGKTVEGRITMGNVTTIQINGASSNSFIFTNLDDTYVDAKIRGNKLIIQGKKVGTTEIKIKETSTEKIAIYKVTIMTANYSIKSGDATVYYGTLADAVNNASDDNIITVLQNVSETQGAIVEKNITIDLQDKKISISSVKTGIEVNKNISLNINGKETGEIYIAKEAVGTTDEEKANEEHIVINNNGTVNVKGGKLTAESSVGNAYGINNNGTVNVTGGEIYGKTYSYESVMIGYSPELSNSTMKSPMGSGINNNGNLNLSDGKIIGDCEVPSSSVARTGYYNINYNCGINNITKGTVYITGGETTGMYRHI